MESNLSISESEYLMSTEKKTERFVVVVFVVHFLFLFKRSLLETQQLSSVLRSLIHVAVCCI